MSRWVAVYQWVGELVVRCVLGWLGVYGHLGVYGWLGGWLCVWVGV